MTRLTLLCKSCPATFRVERVGETFVIGGLYYCPQCGKPTGPAFIDVDTDMWEALEKAYNLPIPLLKRMYELWPHQQYSHFTDFVRSFESEKD